MAGQCLVSVYVKSMSAISLISFYIIQDEAKYGSLRVDQSKSVLTSARRQFKMSIRSRHMDSLYDFLSFNLVRRKIITDVQRRNHFLPVTAAGPAQ